MSTRATKKLSAFSVFKGKKACSLTDVDSVVRNGVSKTPKTPKLSKSSSAGNTPTNSHESSLSSIGSRLGLRNSDKKKEKADIKKMKKMLKNVGKNMRPSYLPDSALSSPLVGNMPNGNLGSVELKALRPKGSMANMRYELPLKATPDATSMSKMQIATTRSPAHSRMKGERESRKQHADTPPPPPLQPRATRRRSAITVVRDNNSLPQQQLHKRSSSATNTAALPPHLPPRAARRSTSATAPPGDSVDVVPSRPPKRRRLSHNTSSSFSSSPKKLAVGSSITANSSSSSGVCGEERTEPLPALPCDADSGLPYMYDSQVQATRLFECLIHPVKPAKFFNELWEKKPLLVKRHLSNYNDGWFSTAELDRVMREERLHFSENIDVVTYTDGKRETHNPPGRAFPTTVWDYYQNGCSVRLLNPHTYSVSVWKLLSILQEYFGCCVGANLYLTPPGTQGFAPHWDDIEAFILQLEGKKHWRLYSPRNEAETLPRYSSDNFTDADIGEPILDVILEAGDLLYFPRGIIHQGQTMDDAHSLHITVSCCQKNSWGDLMEKLVPRALQVAFEEDLEYRKALPRDYLNYMGVAFSDDDCPERKGFLKKIEQLMKKLLPYMPVDAACDQMSKQFIHDSLPPVITEAERECSIHGNGEKWDAENGCIVGTVELEPDTEVKIIRKGVLRLVTEANDVCIYHSLENARVYHGRELQFIDITAELAPGVEYLLHTYPDYTTIDSLPLDDQSSKMELATILYEKGLLITSQPLQPISDDNESLVNGSNMEEKW